MMLHNPELSETVQEAFFARRSVVYRLMLQRAIDRGEIRPDVNFDLITVIGPAMTTFRALIFGRPVERDFLISVIDTFVLPAVGLSPATTAE
jgi:hypothetical protein